MAPDRRERLRVGLARSIVRRAVEVLRWRLGRFDPRAVYQRSGRQMHPSGVDRTGPPTGDRPRRTTATGRAVACRGSGESATAGSCWTMAGARAAAEWSTDRSRAGATQRHRTSGRRHPKSLRMCTNRGDFALVGFRTFECAKSRNRMCEIPQSEFRFVRTCTNRGAQRRGRRARERSGRGGSRSRHESLQGGARRAGREFVCLRRVRQRGRGDG